MNSKNSNITDVTEINCGNRPAASAGYASSGIPWDDNYDGRLKQGQMRKMILAYRAALIELCPDSQKRREVLLKHMERLDA